LKNFGRTARQTDTSADNKGGYNAGEPIHHMLSIISYSSIGDDVMKL